MQASKQSFEFKNVLLDLQLMIVVCSVLDQVWSAGLALVLVAFPMLFWMFHEAGYSEKWRGVGDALLTFSNISYIWGLDVLLHKFV